MRCARAGQLSTEATITEALTGGLIATRIELVATPGLDRASCDMGSDGPLFIWDDPLESSGFLLAPDYRGSVYVIDLDGERVVLVAAIHAAATPGDLAELDAIIQTMRWQSRGE